MSRRSYRWKTFVPLMLAPTLAVAVVVALLAFFLLRSDREQFLAEFAGLGELSAASCRLVLEANSDASVLSAFQADVRVLGACLYARGETGWPIHETFTGEGIEIDFPVEPAMRERYQVFDANLLHSFIPVPGTDQPLGLLYFVADASPLEAGKQNWLGWLAAAGLVALGLAALLTLLVQRRLRKPIRRITRLANRIATEQNFDFQAEMARDDEFAPMLRCINGLIEQIQVRDSTLAQTQDNWERTLDEHTSQLKEKIAERENIADELRRSEEEYRSLVETSNSLIWATDLDGNWTFLNTRGCNMIYGCEPDEMIGKTILDQIHRDYVTDDLQMLNHVRGGEPAFNHETRHTRPDGGDVLLSMNVTTLKNSSGKVIGYTGTAADITARRASEKREQELTNRLARAERMESLGLLAGGVAHDLNNILGPVVAYPDLILEELPEGSESIEDVLEIKKSALRATAVIQDLLTLSRRGKYRLQPLFVREVLEEYQNSASYRELLSKNPGIDVKVQLSDNPRPIRGCFSHLMQVIMNLVQNSFEAMHGEGQLTVRIQNSQLNEALDVYDSIDEGDYVLLRVKDTGDGIPPEYLDRIFEPFFSSKKMGRSGSGLGLAVVYGIVQDLEGFIDIRTREGEGSEFFLYFPVCHDQVPERVIEQQRELTGSGRILVVDDVEEQRILASRTLSKLGYEVQWGRIGAGSGDLPEKFGLRSGRARHGDGGGL